MNEFTLGLMSLAVLAIIFTGIAMSFFTLWYVNHSRRRTRLIELIFGIDNEWYEGKKFDYTMASFVLPGCTLTAWRMKNGWVTAKQRKVGAYAYPMLHINKNYEKFLDEFPFLVRWEAVKFVVLTIGCIGMLVVFGLRKVWW